MLVQKGDCEVVGQHFFAGSTPIFKLCNPELCNLGLYEYFSGEVIATVPAPPGSDPGPLGTGAIPWVALANNGSSIGIQGVYRRETCGGLPPQARPADISIINVEYGSIYEFYMDANQTVSMRPITQSSLKTN